MAMTLEERRSYRQVLADRRLAGLLIGDAVSKVGDGMGFVAMPLLALQLHGTLHPAVAISLVSAAPYAVAVLVSLSLSSGRNGSA